MESSGGSPAESLLDILIRLESKTTGSTERLEGYQKFTKLFKENEINLFDMDVAKNIKRVLTVIKKDIFLPSADTSQCALQVLGVCLHDSEIVSSMSVKDSEDILQSLLDCINTTEEKGTCTRALWCIGKQNLPIQAISKKVSIIMGALELSIEKFGNLSVTVEHETINTIARLAEQCSSKMEGESLIWGKILLPMVVHSAIKVRERALNVVEATMKLMKTHRKEIVAGVMPIFKAKVLPELKNLFGNKQELFVMRCWGTLVQTFGEELHHGVYINNILPIVELGFKSPSPDVKIAAFTAWQQLIDNFATCPNVLGDPKRIKLIMQVFRINNAKLENIAVVKAKVWWHFIWLLGSKITANFDMVAAPFLYFCLGGSRNSDYQNGSTTPRRLQNGASPKTPRMNLSTNGPHNSQLPVFPVLQVLGCEALAHFLGSAQQDSSTVEHDFKLDSLRQDVVTGPSFFIKQSQLFITVATEICISLGKDVPESLFIHIWNCLVMHLKNAIDSPVKLDIRDTLNVLFTQFQLVVHSQVLSSHILLKMFDSVCQLPDKVLSSSAYSVGGNEMINGTPALFLVDMLLTPSLVQSCCGQESFLTLFKSIVASGIGNTSGTLRFLQSVLEIVGRSGKIVEDREMVWKLWHAVITPLLQHFSMTNEVNQGDSLEPNFDGCVQALVFPVEQDLGSMQQNTVRTLVKVWAELYRTVNRLASMVTNAAANVICEEVCHRILGLNKENMLGPENVDLQVNFCHLMTSCLDFSSLGNKSNFNLGTVYSPKKSIKKKLQPLENIHSLVTLFCQLNKHVLDIVGDLEPKKLSISIQPLMNNLIDVYSTIFTHVNSSSIIGHLIDYFAQQLGMLYSESSKKSPSVVRAFSTVTLQKLEQLWIHICTCLQSRYQGLFDTDLLRQLSPVLEVNFLHSRRTIKNQTVSFWVSTFGTASALVYPETLKPVLERVKERSAIPLPGWTSTNTPVIEETPLSQMSQSQIPEPRIPGMPSPHKVHGSFLNKAVSPIRMKSPLKSPVSTRASASAKKIFKGLDSSNEEDFVVIKQSPKKKMVLTEHQREVMKERSVLPAMYNNLELSMDTSLMASHFTTDTQMESSSSTPTPTTENEPFMLFGSSLNKPSGQTKKATEDRKENESKERDSSTLVKDVQEDAEENSRNTRSKSKEKIKNGDSEPSTSSARHRLRRKSMEIKDEKSEIEDKEKDKEMDIGVKGNNSKTGKQLEKDVIVIEESEPIETQTSQVILNSDSRTKDVKKSQSSETVLTKDPESVLLSQAAESFGSFPQNVIGFNFSSSTSSREASGSTDKKASLTEDFPVVSGQTAVKEQKSIDTAVSCVDGHSEVELPASEPLLSWTQKLEELSQSPGLKKSPFKKSLSQDSKSPSKKKSPMVKSPRGKFKENLSMKGALDKWVIRSPVKGTDVCITPHLNSDTDMQSVVSMTYVEETQSPKKMMEKEELNKTNSPSVMETPIKNILEELDVNHSQSNRKLFDSQGSNHGNDMIEDSNLIPASPTSKSFITRCGTPIVRMTRLSDSDLKRFSPSDKLPVKENLTPTKVSDSERQRKKVKYNTDFYKTVGQDESSHEHDDFSDLKPLENVPDNDAECNVLSENPTSTINVPQADAKPKGGVESQNEGHGKHNLAVSPTLFSQLNEHSNDNDLKLNGIAELKTEERSDEIDSCEISEAGSQGFSTDSQSNIEEDNSDHKHDSMTPRRGRKRKQATPRKMSPDDAKSQKKKAAKDDSKDIEQPNRKISKRLKEKKERLSQQNSQETESKTIAGSDDKTEERDSVDDSQGEEKDVDTSFKLDGSQPALDEIHTPRTRRGAKSVKGKSNKDCIENVRKQKMTEIQEKEDPVTGHDTSKQHVDDDNAPCPSIIEDDINKETESSEHEVVDQNADDCTDSTKEQTEMEVDQVVGETTPKSRSTPKQPERRSTTRHKKEIVQKMAQIGSLDNRDEIFLDNDSNMDTDELIKKDEKYNFKNLEGNHDQRNNIQESQDPVTSIDDIEKGVEKAVDDKMGYISNISEKDETIKVFQVCQKEVARIQEHENVFDFHSLSKNEVNFVKDKVDKSKPSGKKAKKSLSDLSSQSDDDIPLIQLKNKKSKGKTKTSLSKQVKKQEKDGRRSPVSLRLQSNKYIGTRLRSGLVKVKTSPQSKKSVSLALKRTRMKLRQNVNEKIKDSVPNKESVSDDVNAKKEVLKDSDEPLVNIDKVEKEFENETCQLGEVCEKPEEISVEKQDNLEPGSFKELFGTESSSEKNGAIENLVTQEATDTNETPRKLIEKSKQAASMLLMNSDSKLVLGSRRFEKRKGMARRSILKPSTLIATSMVESPKRTNFHPITVSRICSPTASPSASILKKRRLLDNCDTDTDSPPAKQRRVSFAEPLVEEGNTAVPLDNDKPTPTVATETESSEKKQTGSQFTQNSSCQSSEGVVSQGTYQSTQESELNNTEPVCPDLIDCEQSVEKILPQLTSSIWSRGLGQLVRARNIKTIGDLSALSEVDILGLPIRSPKVETVRKILSKFQNHQNRTGKSKDSPRVRLETKILSEGQTSSEVCEDNTGITNDAEAIKDAQDVFSSGSDFGDKINGLSQNLGQNKETGTDQSDSRSDPDTSKKFMENFGQMMACFEDNLDSLNREQLGEVLKTITRFQASTLLAVNWKDK